MIQEFWTLEVTHWDTSENPWVTIANWCEDWAQSARSSEHVKDAYGLRSDAGAEEFNRVHLVMVFESMADRHEYYRGGADAMQKMLKAIDENYFSRTLASHYYYAVYR